MTADEMILRIRDATRKIEEMRSKTPTELRLHPEDFEAIKRRFAPLLTHPANNLGDSIMGMRLVLDENAERLPRKTNQ